MNGNEAGIRALRANFVREVVQDITPDDPDWLRFSDELDSLTATPNSNIFSRSAIGSPDVTGFELGPESHEMTVVYSMQRWLAGAGPVPLDAAGDGILRDASGGYLSTHSLLTRQSYVSGGADSGGRRIYTYGTGGIITRVMISGAPESGDPSKVNLTYLFKKLRSYKIDQPSASDTLEVVSTDAADTTQTVTIEDEGGAVTETIALNGTTPVAGAISFDNIDAIRLSAECQGDVQIRRVTGSVVLCTIEGVTTNGGIEGDLGLPLLGAGSYEAALGLPFQTVLRSSFSRGGAALADNVMGVSFEVNNNVEANALAGTRLRSLSPGNRAVTFNGTVFSATSSHDDFIATLKAETADMVWTFFGGASARTVTINDAALTGVGARAYEKGAATMRRNNVFTGQGVAVSTGL